MSISLSTIIDDCFADVTRVETDYLEETGSITVSWGGPERGHSCVTHYDVKVRSQLKSQSSLQSVYLQVSGPGHDEDEMPTRQSGDNFYFIEEGVEKGATYSFTIFPVSNSTDFQADITGPGTTVTVQT